MSCFKISVPSKPFALPARMRWAQCVLNWTRTNSHKTSTKKLVSSSSLCCLFVQQSQLPACAKISPSSVNLKTMLHLRSRKGNYRMNDWPSLTCFVCMCLQGLNLYFLSCLGKHAWPYLLLWSGVDLAKKKKKHEVKCSESCKQGRSRCFFPSAVNMRQRSEKESRRLPEQSRERNPWMNEFSTVSASWVPTDLAFQNTRSEPSAVHARFHKVES